jgi:hypothetical protein
MKALVQILASICLIFLSTNSQAQIYITGTLTDQTGKMLPGASLLIKGSYDGGVTDTAGFFGFQTTEATGQKVVLMTRFMGYETRYDSIMLNSDTLKLQLTLKEKFNELTAVQISAGAFEAGDKKKAVHLNSLDMITVPGSQGNVVGALQYLPGTSTVGESGKLFVRGGSSRESQTFIDGALVPIAFNPSAPNTAVRSKFNPFMFEGMVFSTGGFSAEYGQALSSVLLLETKGLQHEDQLDISFLSVGLGLSGTKRWKTSAITASFDHTNLLPYLLLVPQSIDWIKPPVANNGALNFRRKTKNGLLKSYTNYNDANFSLHQPDASNAFLPTRYDLSNHNLYQNISFKTRLNEKWLLKLSSSLTADRNQIKIPNDQFTEQLLLAHGKMKFQWLIQPKIKVNFGTELIAERYSEELTSLPNMHWQTDRITAATFVESQIHLSTRIVARIGGRIEYCSQVDPIYFSPRFSFAFKTGKFSQISMAGGIFHQPPNRKHQIYQPHLVNEISDQIMLNYQWSKKKRTLRAEVYAKNYRSLVTFSSAPFYDPTHYQSQGHGFAQGIDIFYRDQTTIRNGDFWISYSFIDTERKSGFAPVPSTPSFVSTHNLSVVYKHWIRKWRSLVGMAYNFGSPRKYNDPNSAIYNDEETRPYQSLNLNWSYLYRENIIFYGSVSNVLGFQQEFGYEFTNEPNADGLYEKRLISPPAPRFFILGCFITLSKSGDKNQLDKIN